MPSNWKHLSQIPLFSSICERRLRKLASKATEDAYETRDVILSEGGRTDRPPSRPGDRRFLERCGPREVVVECWTSREKVEMGRHLTRTRGSKGRRGIYVQEAPRGPEYKLAYRDGRGVVTSKRSIDRVAVPAAQPERSQSRRTWNRSTMKCSLHSSVRCSAGWKRRPTRRRNPRFRSRYDRARITGSGPIAPGEGLMKRRLQTPGSTDRLVVVPEARRQRRPTGAPPPLPKQIGLTGKLWLAAVLVVVVSGVVWLHFTTGPLDRFDAVIIRFVTSARTPWLESLTNHLNSVGSRLGRAICGLLTAALAAAFRRWRHLAVFLVSVAALMIVFPILYTMAARPRPYSVTAIGDWEGFSSPSQPVLGLTGILIGFIYMLVVPGRPRWYAKLAIVAILALVSLQPIYLGVDHPTDLAFAIILGVAVPVALFRAFTPSDVFPVRYGRHGKSAHLDVGGARGEAIRRAVQEQLGFVIIEMKPVGLEASGGSTPLKLRVADEQGRRAVGVREAVREEPCTCGPLVQARPHDAVRPARGRDAVQDGPSVRRVRGLHAPALGEYGPPRPRPCGIVEITPEREYLIAMEFFDDARGDRRRRDRRPRDRRGTR